MTHINTCAEYFRRDLGLISNKSDLRGHCAFSPNRHTLSAILAPLRWHTVPRGEREVKKLNEKRKKIGRQIRETEASVVRTKCLTAQWWRWREGFTKLCVGGGTVLIASLMDRLPELLHTVVKSDSLDQTHAFVTHKLLSLSVLKRSRLIGKRIQNWGRKKKTLQTSSEAFHYQVHFKKKKKKPVARKDLKHGSMTQWM